MYEDEYDETYDEMIKFNDQDTIIMNKPNPEVDADRNVSNRMQSQFGSYADWDNNEAPEVKEPVKIPVEDELYEDYDEDYDPIVRTTASTQDDIAEARNHYEAMVRSTTVS